MFVIANIINCQKFEAHSLDAKTGQKNSVLAGNHCSEETDCGTVLEKIAEFVYIVSLKKFLR